MLRLDHVVYAVPDLDEAAVRFREEFGLDSTAGGRHERWGTSNRIVPLGDQSLPATAFGLGGSAWVEIVGDAERLRDWLGGEELPIRVIEASRACGGWASRHLVGRS